MKIVGYQRADFTAKDGTEVKGCSVYTEQVLSGKDVLGVKTDRFFLSDKKMKTMGLDLPSLVGKEVHILYNRFGKPESITEDEIFDF